MKKLKKYLPLGAIIILSIIAWLFDLHHYFSFEIFRIHQNSLDLFIKQNLLLSIIIYSVTYIAVVGLSIPGATFMTVMGGFFWGQWVGVVMAVFSATLGGSIVFLSTKMASSDLLSKKTDGLVKKMQKGFSKNAFSYLLTLRFIPIVPFVAVNMVAAFFQIPLRTFFLGTFFGIIPGSFVYASIGVALREVIQKPDLSINMLFDLRILLAFTGLGILSLTPIVYQYLKKNRS